MRFPVRRRWIAIAVLFAGPAVTVMGASEWVRETAKDIIAYPSAEKEMRVLKEKNDDYQQEINLVIRRCAIKESILEDLETGKMTLFIAANRFLELDRNSRVL